MHLMLGLSIAAPLAGPARPAGSGLLLESAGFLLLESADFLLLE